MVEYGHGISDGGAGQVGGGGGGGAVGGGGGGDWGAAIGHAVNDAWLTFTALQPWQMALIVIAIIGGLIILRRAF
jgi:hypothetical protein